MKKKLVAIFITILAFGSAAFSAIMLYFKPDSQGANTGSTNSVANDQSSVATNSSSSEVATTSSSTSSEATNSTGLTDGTYTGAVTSTNRGDYQVQMTVSGGTITDITVLEYPSDNPTSESINANALPTYTAEALDSQSADINAISGATIAFEGFTGSLQDAINQAQA